MKTTTLEFRWTVSRGRDTYGYNICSLYADGRKVAACNGGGYDMKGSSLGTFIARAYADRLLNLKLEDMPENSHWQPENARHCAGKCEETYRAGLMAAIGKGIRAAKAYEKSVKMDKLPSDCFECPHCKGPTHPSREGKRVNTGRSFYGLRFINPNYDPGAAIVEHAPCFGKEEDAGKTVAVLESEGKSLGLERYQAFWKETSHAATKLHRIPSIDGACGFSSVEKIMEAIGLKLEYVPTRSKNNALYQLHDSRAE